MKKFTVCITCIGLSLLTACQSTSTPKMTQSAEVNQQTQYFVEAKISLDKLKQDINQGKKDRLDYFAPGTYQEALEEFDNATEEYMDIGQNGASSLNIFQSDTEQYKDAKQEIINYIALANQRLKFAYSIKETAETTLAATFAQKAVLQAIGAPEVYAKDYQEIDEIIDELVEYIDEGKVSTAQGKQPELLTSMQALEVRTVRKNALGQLDTDIAYINKKRLAKYVPISYQQLLTARSNANAIITATPRASDEINAAVALAEFELAHLYHTAKEVDTLKETKSSVYEQYLLTKETLLHSITQALGTADVRDLPMAEQVEAIALQAEILKGKLTVVNDKVLALQSDSNQSSAATENLRTELTSELMALNNKYDALVMKNTQLNKQLQSKDLELVRLSAYKEAVLQVEGKHAAEQALALKANAKKEAERKVKAAAEKAKKEALALEVKAEAEAEKASMLRAQQRVPSEVINEVAGPATQVIENKVADEVVETVVEAPITPVNNH